MTASQKSAGSGTLMDLVVRSARSGAGLQAPGGAMPAGRNGPYGHPEKPLRNTGHWLVTFLAAARRTDDAKLWEAAHQGLAYVLDPAHRPHGATFHHREAAGKDRCNGLVGQAWSIEALAEAARELRDTEAARVARDTFLLHPWGEARPLWSRVETDGRPTSVDPTFNHQLWFAAAGSLLPNAEVRARVLRFLDALPSLFRTDRAGIVQHFVPPQLSSPLVLAMRLAGRGRAEDPIKALGYHAFNLAGLAHLRIAHPGHRSWRHGKLRRAVAAATHPAFRSALEGNPYAYPYNPPGFEVPFALHAFAAWDDAHAQAWVRRQLELGWDNRKALLQRGTPDPATMAARLYEATRLPELKLAGASEAAA